MLEWYEGLPEWLRWVLFIPLLLLVEFLFGFLVRIFNVAWAGTFLFERLFFPFINGGASVLVTAFLIPRAKIVAAYVSTAIWALFCILFALGLFLPITENLPWRDLVQSAAGLAGAIVGLMMWKQIQADRPADEQA